MNLFRSRFVQAVLILGVSYGVLRFGIQPPAPRSVMLLYMAIVAMATLVFVSSDSDSWRAFVRPIRATLVAPERRLLRLALMVVIPILLGLLGLVVTILALFSRPYRQLSTRYAGAPEQVLTG